MTTLNIFDPATGTQIDSIAADTSASIAAKYQAARAAQISWAAQPLSHRKECIARFRAAVVQELPALALTMTRETGKPIAMSRNELNGLLGRIDFFLEKVDAAIATETVFTDASMTEQIEHIPLGVVANISAWNYPWFVGCNVLIPALLTGNAVLYKPSEFASLTGLAIVRLLHQAGVPTDLLAAVIGGGEQGAALLAQPINGLFFTGSHATGVKLS
jgi:acyl-CoA reductase-like NAD-dependent aldehyde dehydrogenase